MTCSRAQHGSLMTFTVSSWSATAVARGRKVDEFAYAPPHTFRNKRGDRPLRTRPPEGKQTTRKLYTFTYAGTVYVTCVRKFQMYKRLLYLGYRQPQPGEFRPQPLPLRRWFDLMAAQWEVECHHHWVKQRWEPDWGHVSWGTKFHWLCNPYNGEYTYTCRL